MPKLWRIAAHDPAGIAALEQAAGIPAVVAQLLLARGIRDADDARQFLDPKLTGLRDPELLPGVTAAAEILYEAVRAKRRITVYGDYDADGMTATAILVRCLRLLDAEVDFYVPHRIDEGYGLNDDALRKLAEQGADVVVTVDCGIASLREAELAAELGLTLIVTDHHQDGATLPRAAAIVHPGLPGRRLSLSRPVRRGRRPQARLGLVPTRLREQARQRPAATIPAAGRRPRRHRHGGRRRAARR